ncbi:MAG: tetratricopeptide repeat protein [Candidatus Sericytochromatia bacterium]|nr:tetratricopeptide repeat protein [Candidatus Sericytochromatia bacterium]
MEKTISLFRKSFLQITVFVGLITLLFKLIPIAIGTLLTNQLPDASLIIHDTIYSLIMALLFAQVLPLMITLFYGEWLYTRSFNPHQIFRLVWGEFLKWFGLSSLILISTVYIFKNNNTIDLFTILLSISIELYLALILAGNNKTSTKILKTSIPVIFLVTCISYLSFRFTHDSRSYTGLGVWAVYLALCYLMVSKYNGDVEINVPGSLDDEMKSISGRWLLNKEFNYKKTELKKQSGVFKLISQFRLLTRQSSNLYTQMLAVFLVIISFFVFIDVFEQNVSNADENINFLLSSMAIIFSSLLIVFYAPLITIINPKYILLSKEEFLLSRAVSRIKIYFSNFLNQFIFISAICVIAYIVGRSGSYINVITNRGVAQTNYFELANHLAFIGLGLWLFIAGEVGLLVFIILLIIETTLPMFSNLGFQSLTYSFLFNLNTSGIFSFSLWATAIFFRLWDYNNFRNKEMGFSKSFKNILKELNKSYSIPILIMLAVTFVTAFTNPFTFFLNTFVGTNDTKYLSNNILSSIFFKTDSPINSAINNFKLHPYDKNNMLKMAEVSLFDERYYSKGDDYIAKINYFDYDTHYIDHETINTSEYWLNKYDNVDNNPDVHYIKSVIDVKEYKYSEAIKELESIKGLKKKKYLMQLAYLYENEVYYKKAINIYNQLGQLYPDKKDYSLYKIGDIYWINGLYKQGLEAYYQASLINKSEMPIRDYYSYGLCDQIKKIAKESNNYDIRLSIQRPLNLCNNNDQDIKYTNYEIDKININAYNHKYYNTDMRQLYVYEKGNYYVNSNKLDKAIDYYKRIIKENRSTKPYGDLALVYLKKGDKQNAIKTVESGLEIKVNNEFYSKIILKKNVDYKLYLADFKLNKDNTDLSIAKKLLLTAPDTNQVWNELNITFSSKPNELNELKALKSNIDNLYNYFSNTHDNYSTNLRNIEKTQLIIYKIGSQKDKVRGIKKLESEISKL